jgi:hypothetical protein
MSPWRGKTKIWKVSDWDLYGRGARKHFSKTSENLNRHCIIHIEPHIKHILSRPSSSC